MRTTSLKSAIQRGREIRDAANGDTIPGDPDHGRWSNSGAPHGTAPIAEPVGYKPPSLPVSAQPIFNLPQRYLPPISVAPDSLTQFNRPNGIPGRRVIPPKPL